MNGLIKFKVGYLPNKWLMKTIIKRLYYKCRNRPKERKKNNSKKERKKKPRKNTKKHASKVCPLVRTTDMTLA
jgi:hypothetical protein